MVFGLICPIAECSWVLTGEGVLVELILTKVPWFDNLTTVEQEISFMTVFILLIQASVINKVCEIYSKTLRGRFNSQEN